MFKKKAASALASFYDSFMRVLYPCRIHLENPEKRAREQGEIQQQTQPTYGTRPASNAGHIDGKRAFLSLRHPCSSKPWLLYFSLSSSSSGILLMIFRIRFLKRKEKYIMY